MPEIELKLYNKHQLLVEEVEEVLFGKPHARTLEEMAEFWDTHSLADYDEQTYEVEMTFDPSARRTNVAIEPELMADIAYVARLRRVSPETLINVWLRQQVDRVAQI